jgi:pSer/pThr/pTyr-binding forkhead associated (FHA) protein
MLLQCKNAKGAVKTMRLKEMTSAPPVTIGRGTEATICLDDNRCSRLHCSIRYWDDIFIIRDMHSSNGTILNGQKIEVSKLAPGDVVKIGDTEIRCSSEGTSGEATMGPS